MLHLPGSVTEAKNTQTEIDCFELFLSPPIVRMIVTSTDIYIRHIQGAFGREKGYEAY